MPRSNLDGRTATFILESRDREGGQDRGRGGRNPFRGQIRFGDHDTRDSRDQFKFVRKGQGIQKKKGHFLNTRLDDGGDTIMDGAGPSSGIQHHANNRFNQRGRGKNKSWRRQQRPDAAKGENHQFGPGWHKVTIINGASYTREFLLTSLANASRYPYTPVAISNAGTNTVFYVEDRKTAESLAECSGRITGPDAQKILLRVNVTGTPPTPVIDETCEARLRAVLEKRFNPVTLSLNLSNFHSSLEIVNDYYMPLYRPVVTTKIWSLMEPFMPTLLSLDMSNNKLTQVDNFSVLAKNAPNLKTLDLSNNRLQNAYCLQRLEGLQIIELILDRNPLCDKFNDAQRYISDIRKKFPKLQKLDGKDVPPQISFDLEAKVKIPTAKGSYFCNEEAKKVVLTFLEQYLAIFDSDNRQPLLDAYHDQSMMSMEASYNSGHVSTNHPAQKLSHYIADSRNMMRQTDRQKRYKLLHQGKLDIVGFLNKLPKTTHDVNSLLVDMPIAMSQLVLFTVSGIFKEREDRLQPLRYFARTFTLVPQNHGFCITNELFFITNPVGDQVKWAFTQPAPTPSPSPVPYVQPSTSAAALASSTVASVEQQRQLITQFATQSAMNDEWSKKCLEENAWDFQKSAFVFTELHKQGKIPPEAFIK